MHTSQMQGPPLYSVGPGTCRKRMPNKRCSPRPLQSQHVERLWSAQRDNGVQSVKLSTRLRQHADAPAVGVVARAAEPPGPDAVLEHAQRDAPVHDEHREQERRQVQQPQQQGRLPRHAGSLLLITTLQASLGATLCQSRCPRARWLPVRITTATSRGGRSCRTDSPTHTTPPAAEADFYGSYLQHPKLESWHRGCCPATHFSRKPTGSSSGVTVVNGPFTWLLHHPDDTCTRAGTRYNISCRHRSRCDGQEGIASKAAHHRNSVSLFSLPACNRHRGLIKACTNRPSFAIAEVSPTLNAGVQAAAH